MEAAFNTTGVVRFAKKTEFLAGLVAHECGHAVTTYAQFSAREGNDAGWASELCANRYVCKWGFDSRRWRRIIQAQFGHMVGLPGTTVTVGSVSGGTAVTFRVTKDFRLQRF
ncbi:MAG TPA: hypothetical protein VKZ50_02655 [bacterium]|nr:hypothetical protein [bacterium]